MLLGEGDDGHHRVDADRGGEEGGVGDVEVAVPWTEPSAAQTPSPASAAIRAVPIGWKASRRSSEGLKRVASKSASSPGREHADAGDVGVDLGRAGGEVDFGGAGDAEGEAVGVVVGRACRWRAASRRR